MDDAFGPQRGRTVFVVGVGSAMDDEWKTGRVPQALHRLAEAVPPYMLGYDVSVVHFGTRVELAGATTIGKFDKTGRFARPNCGPGSNLTGALHMALSQREVDEPLHIYVVSDCDMPEAELAHVKRIITNEPNVVLMVVRVSTDTAGMNAAYELDEFASGPDDRVELIHYNDGRGRNIGENLEALVRHRMSIILTRRAQASV